jgi:hypothetical protein
MQQQFKRISIASYLEQHFVEGSRSNRTVMTDIRKGRLQGELLHGKWYVFVDENLNPICDPEQRRAEIIKAKSTGNPIADAILARTQRLT